MRASQQDRPDIHQARRRWRRLQGGFDPNRLVFIDESAAKTNMTRLRGRCRRGRRLHASAPHGHWHTTTMIGSIRLDGASTAMTIEGATDANVFSAYVRHVLSPSLRPGDIVVMDNLAPHKSPQACALIEAAGAEVLFLPPYSPDFNPIEKMWSKLKALLRRTAARTREGLLAAIADALAQVTPQDARGWFVSCGYSFI